MVPFHSKSESQEGGYLSHLEDEDDSHEACVTFASTSSIAH